MGRLTDDYFHASIMATRRSTTIMAGVAVIITVNLLILLLTHQRRNRRKLIQSPAVTLLPKLSIVDRATLEYPPDVLPGGRDVDTPFGRMKVYEWGPQHGQKVLFVHGITTTCISLGAVAHGLVDRGYRVMLFDLWGRGYSDCPADLPHDERLYSTQILLAIISSPLAWIGVHAEEKFNVIGYSLGGGISAVFTSYFPDMVKSLVLISPTGLIRKEHGNPRAYFRVLSRIIPDAILNPLLQKFLTNDLLKHKGESEGPQGDGVKRFATGDVLETDTPRKPHLPLSRAYPKIDIISAGLWHINLHQGLIDSFKSTIRYGPIFDRQEAYQRLVQRSATTLVITGSTDPLIIACELKEDLEAIMGESHLHWRLIRGAHDIPCSHPTEIIDTVHSFWSEAVA